jgi:hypothetical protein
MGCGIPDNMFIILSKAAESTCQQHLLQARNDQIALMCPQVNSETVIYQCPDKLKFLIAQLHHLNHHHLLLYRSGHSPKEECPILLLEVSKFGVIQRDNVLWL